NSKSHKAYFMENFTEEERSKLKAPKDLYNITFEKPGGLVMPLIVEYRYADGTYKKETYPAEVWRLNDNEIKKAIASEKEIIGIIVDPNLETADVDTSNNYWPRKSEERVFDRLKQRIGS